MYDKIFNPYTKRYVNIKSTYGFKVLNNYINQLGGVSLVQAKMVKHGKLVQTLIQLKVVGTVGKWLMLI